MIQRSTPPTEAAVDIDSERALVSACLVDPRKFDVIGDMVCGRDFFDQLAGAIFDVLHHVHVSGEPANDAKVILPILRAANLPLHESENIAAIIGKLLGEGIPANAKFYALRVRALSQLRQLSIVACEVAHRAADPAENPQELAGWLDAKLQAIGQSSDTSARQADTIAAELLAEIDEQMKAGKPRGVPSGFPTFDLTAGSFMPGELTIVAAGPGTGKTALGMQLAEHSAEHQRRVLVVSLEMRDKELILRTLCKLAGVNSRDVRAGNINTNERERLGESAEAIRGLPLQIWSTNSANTKQIRASCKLQVATGGLSLVVVDYVGLVKPDDPRLKRFEQVAQVTRDLKGLAKELRVPVIALAQLNREVGDGEPKLSHLAESSALERDADQVLFLHRKPNTSDAIELIIAKHRHGAVGRLTLGWDPVATQFFDVGTCDPSPEVNERPRTIPRKRQAEFDTFNGR